MFLVRQKLGKFNLLLEPLAGIDIKHLGQPTPADVPDENGLFVVGRETFLGFEATQKFDRLDVGAELLLERPFAETVAVGDPVVSLITRWA